MSYAARTVEEAPDIVRHPKHARDSRMKALLVALLLAALSIPSAAHAYVDPGTGSYFLQILLAGILGGAFAVRIYWRRIRRFLARRGPGRDNLEEGRQAGEDGRD